MRSLTFYNIDELLHVVVDFAVVNYSSNWEDQFGLDLRKSVKDALSLKKNGKKKTE